jgi:hypothetical protein
MVENYSIMNTRITTVFGIIGVVSAILLIVVCVNSQIYMQKAFSNLFVLPPEINSVRMYTGPGSGPMLAAERTWDGLAAELGDAIHADFQHGITKP